jgi:hypothetical protein
MTQRYLKPEPGGSGYHRGWHHEALDCDEYPACEKLVPFEDGGTRKCHCGAYTWQMGETRWETRMPGNHSIASCSPDQERWHRLPSGEAELCTRTNWKAEAHGNCRNGLIHYGTAGSAEAPVPKMPGDVTYDPPPTHYDGNGIDPWAVWDAFDLDRYTANAVKYLLRAGKKDIAPRLDDLKKAANYVAKAIEMEEKRDQ